MSVLVHASRLNRKLTSLRTPCLRSFEHLNVFQAHQFPKGHIKHSGDLPEYEASLRPLLEPPHSFVGSHHPFIYQLSATCSGTSKNDTTVYTVPRDHRKDATERRSSILAFRRLKWKSFLPPYYTTSRSMTAARHFDISLSFIFSGISQVPPICMFRSAPTPQCLARLWVPVS